MSRIGKKPVVIAKGIEVSVEGSVIRAAKGNLKKSLETHGRVGIELNENEVVFSSVGDTKESAAYWGTYRALFSNIIIGLDQGFQKSLEINGVGYRASIQGNKLVMQLGYSHDINYEIPQGLEITVDKNVVTIKGSDKQVVGQVAAEIRDFRPPEPYKGKGVKYSDEKIIRKAGKSSGKKK